MSTGLLSSLLLAAATAAAAGGLYLAWPRGMSAEEWVLSRRQAALGPAPARRSFASAVLGGDGIWARRLRAVLVIVRADLRLLAAHGHSTMGEEELAATLVRLACVGAAGGLVLGLTGWLAAGHEGVPLLAVLLAVVGVQIVPGLRWVHLQHRATLLRTAVERRLPRLLTGAHVLLESGAATPRGALSAAIGTQRDPAADVLREVVLYQEVRQVELADALDHVGEAYAIEPLQRLGDVFRVGTRQGTRMADLLSTFALDMRRAEHVAYRERMTRAPVLMTVPALVFFVLPLLALVLMLVFAPLDSALGQL